MRQSEVFKQKLAEVATNAETKKAYNAALASNLYRQGFKNLIRDMGAKPVKLNGFPPVIIFPDHSQLLGTVPA